MPLLYFFMVPPEEKGTVMIYIDQEKEEPLYIQIYDQIRHDILSGNLKENQVLTGSRTLAKTLQISRNTVDNAYSQLCAEGYITPQKGIGYVVMPIPKILNKKSPVIQNKRPDDKILVKHIKYDLTNSSFTSDLFPKKLWKKFTPVCLDMLDNESKLRPYQDKNGSQYLRSHLLKYLHKIRGVSCTEDQIIITCGFQNALNIICELILQGNATVLVEEPGFDKATSVFRNNGCNVKAMPIDDQGLITSQLPCQNDIQAVYTTPSHQFPTGVTMPIGRRYELLHWANEHNAYIIEDDFDSELRYYARPVPSLQSVDLHDCVIYLGTFFKAISPSIRKGYMILPPKLKKTYDEKYQNYSSTVPLLNQLIIGKLLETEQYDRHVRKLNQIFRKRLELFYKELSDVQDKIKISSNGSGQYFLLKFSETVNQEELIASAFNHGVQVYSTMNFWQEKADCPPNTLFLGFSKIRLEDIPDCVKRLKSAWKTWLYQY